MGQESEEMSTEYVLVPEGEWEGQAQAPVVRKTQGVKDPTATYYFLDVPFEISDPMVLKEMNRENAAVARFSSILDLTTEGKIDSAEGKNVKLGRLREAMGLNSAGFKLPDLEGGLCRVKVKHDTGKDGITRSPVIDATTL